MKKSIFSTNSSDNFSNNQYKNKYQRKVSQESNSKLSSSTSKKDSIYKSLRYIKIKNIFRGKKSSLLSNNDIILKTEDNSNQDIIRDNIEITEK